MSKSRYFYSFPVSIYRWSIARGSQIWYGLCHSEV